jgi:prepilin-type N-terminal cleavage/methylation domain-containing protein
MVSNRHQQGFSLIEVAVATAIIGVGIAAVIVSTRSGTDINGASREMTQALFLANEIREWTLKLPFCDQDPGDKNNPPGPDGTNPQTYVDDLDDLMNVTYCPPRRCPGAGDNVGPVISGMSDWSQVITLEWKNPANLQTTVTAGSSNIIRVKVQILHRSNPVLATGWLVARKANE